MLQNLNAFLVSMYVPNKINNSKNVTNFPCTALLLFQMISSPENLFPQDELYW